jgi:hypothetical protein
MAKKIVKEGYNPPPPPKKPLAPEKRGYTPPPPPKIKPSQGDKK